MSDLPTTSSSTGMKPNFAGALAYLLLPLTGILFLALEKEDRFVRFHAAQAIVIGAAAVVVSVILGIISTFLGIIPVLGGVVAFVITSGFSIVVFLLWVLLMFRAYQGQKWEVPVASEYARKLIAS